MNGQKALFVFLSYLLISQLPLNAASKNKKQLRRYRSSLVEGINAVDIRSATQEEVARKISLSELLLRSLKSTEVVQRKSVKLYLEKLCRYQAADLTLWSTYYKAMSVNLLKHKSEYPEPLHKFASKEAGDYLKLSADCSREAFDLELKARKLAGETQKMGAVGK